jgi:hypothetical protein
MPLIPMPGPSEQLDTLLSGRQSPERAARPRRRPSPDVRSFAGPLPSAVLRLALATAEQAALARHPAEEFGVSRISCADLAALAAMALTADGRGPWAPAGPGLVLLLAALRTDSLPRGLYWAEQREKVLFIPLGAPVPRGEEEGRGPGALFLITGNMRQAASSARGHGYPALLVRAGALGRAVCGAAATCRLAATADAGTSHEVTAAARLADPGLRHLLTVAVGTPR